MIGNRGARGSAVAALLGAACLMGYASAGAHAYDDNVKQHCTDDYFAYCSQHAPESTDVRYCMEANRNKLSKQCVSALVDAGEVPRKYLSKQANERK